MPEKMWRPTQLAAELQVSPKTITRWIEEGKIKVQRTLGGSIGRGHARIPFSEVERLKELFESGSRVGVVVAPPNGEEGSP